MIDPMQQINALRAQLGIGAVGGQAGMPPYPGMPAPALTVQDVQSMIDASMARVVPQPAQPAILGRFDDLFKRALAPEDFAAFAAYTQQGAPGFAELVQSDKLFPLAQLLWDEIKGIKK